MTIPEIALRKETEYNDKYLQWCKDNPGYIMNGLSSKAMAANLASHCTSIVELESLISIYTRKAELMKGPHGCNFFVSAFKEILEEYLDSIMYCPECTGCGELACCNPLSCTQGGNCLYGSSYLTDLKEGYYCYDKLTDVIYSDTDKYKELIASIDKIEEESHNKFYVTCN